MANLKVRPGWRGTGNNDNAVNFYQVNLGKKSHAGKIIGGGTSSDPVLSSTASEKMASFYTQNSATSGESYGFYWRHKVTGIAGSATCARFYSYTNVAATDLQGLHVTAETGAAGTVSGQLIGVRSQLIFGADATATPTGTIAGGQSELYFNGSGSSTTDITTTTKHSIHRFIVDGDATAYGKVQNAFEFVNVTVGTSTATDLVNTTALTASHNMRVIINGDVYGVLLDKY